MTRLLVIGAGGHGLVVADAAAEAGFTEVAFLDDAVTVPPGGFRLAGTLADLIAVREYWQAAIPAMGDNGRRLEVLQRLREAGYRTPAVVHPAAVVSRRARLGDGVFVAAGGIVNAGAEIGDAVIVNTGATVDHDCVVAAGAHISPGAHLGGNVRIGTRSWIGIGAAVRHGVSIGSDTVVGAGAAVVADVPDCVTVVGVPARAVRRRENG